MKNLRFAHPGVLGAPSSFVVILGTAIAYIVLGYLLAAVGPANPEIVGRGFSPILLPTSVDVHPEPLDRFLFISLILAAPVVLAGVIAFASRLSGDVGNPAPVFWSLVCATLAICIIKGAIPEISRLLYNWQWIATTICLVAAGSLVALPDRLHSTANKAVVVLTLALAVSMIASQRIWTLSSVGYVGGPVTLHYEAVVSPLIRIATGGTCLVEVIPQYGCFGEFLAPFVQLLGGTVLVITLIFVVLQIASVIAVMIFAQSLLASPAIIAGCFLSLLIAAGLNLNYDLPDPILQYFPLRFFFPALSLPLVMWFQRGPTKTRSLLMGAFSGASMAWNLESGIAVMVSLAIFSAAGNFTDRPWEKRSQILESMWRLAMFVMGCGIFLAVFAAYLFVKSASTPDFAKILLFQEVFYITGFGMIPIPSFPDYWTIHAAVMFCTLLLGAFWAASSKRTRDPELELATYLAVLSIGIFLYYSGRSHILVLRLVAWPSIILFYFLMDRTAHSMASRAGHLLLATVSVVGCALPAAFLLKTAPVVAHLAATVRHTPPVQNVPVREDIAFLTSRASPREAVAIIAHYQGVLYGESGLRAALEGPGVVETVRRVDLDDQVKALVERGPDKLFLGTNLSRASKLGLLATDIDIDLNYLRTAYALAEVGPGERLYLLRRKPYTGKDLFDSDTGN